MLLRLKFFLIVVYSSLATFSFAEPRYEKNIFEGELLLMKKNISNSIYSETPTKIKFYGDKDTVISINKLVFFGQKAYFDGSKSLIIIDDLEKIESGVDALVFSSSICVVINTNTCFISSCSSGSDFYKTLPSKSLENIDLCSQRK